MKTQILITIIAFINGYAACWSIHDTENLSIKIKIRLVVLFSIFGILLFSLSFLIGIIKLTLVWIQKTLQLKFWYMYFISKEFNNLDTEKLNNLNLNGKRYFGHLKNINKRMAWMDHHFLYCLKLIRKNYSLEKDSEWSWIDNKENFKS